MMASPVALLRPPVSLSLLDEEVDRDRHHRPDAGHHQCEQAAERRGDQEGNAGLAWAFWAISLWTLAADELVGGDGGRCNVHAARWTLATESADLALRLDPCGSAAFDRRFAGRAVQELAAGLGAVARRREAPSARRPGRVHWPGMLQVFASQTM